MPTEMHYSSSLNWGRSGAHREPAGVARGWHSGADTGISSVPRPTEALWAVRILYVPHRDHFINRHFGQPEDGGIASDVWSSITLRQRNKTTVNSLPENHLAMQWLLSCLNDKIMPSFLTTPNQQVWAGFSVSHREAQPCSSWNVLQV